MHPQEREELDYYPQSEAELAYAWSRMQTQLQDPKINEAIQRGKFVVVARSTAYCPSTDAVLGTRNTFISEHDSYEDALAAIDASPFQPEEDQDLVVQPMPPVSPTSPETNDNCPF